MRRVAFGDLNSPPFVGKLCWKCFLTTFFAFFFFDLFRRARQTQDRRREGSTKKGDKGESTKRPDKAFRLGPSAPHHSVFRYSINSCFWVPERRVPKS